MHCEMPFQFLALAGWEAKDLSFCRNLSLAGERGGQKHGSGLLASEYRDTSREIVEKAQTSLYKWDETAVNSEENLKQIPGWARSTILGDPVTWKRWSLSLIHSALLNTCHMPGQDQNVAR